MAYIKPSKKISVIEAMSIGIGGMVGGGIFAVLGLAVELAQGGTPLAFFFAGVVAFLTCYSYAKLSKVYPDRGGTVKFINQGFGRSVFSGGMNNLLWISYIVMLSLYASAFGSYAPNLWHITDSMKVDFHIYATFVIIVSAIINYYSIKVVSEIESLAVGIKLVILMLFIVIGLYGLLSSPYVEQLNVEHWENPVKLFAGGMVIFVAYEGFELIANAAPDIIEPEKNISRAYFGSVVFVILLYIIIAIVTVGALPFSEIANAQDYVLAEAARPTLGQLGFTVITVAALISTFSAINASIYGGGQVNYEIARDDELPHYFVKNLLHQPIGLMITVVATLVLVNVLNLESISTVGSVGFLVIFGAVNLAAVKLRKNIKANFTMPFIGSVLCFLATVILLHQQWQDNRLGVYVAVAIMTGCFLTEAVYRRTKHSQGK